jgi:ferric-dicitrate binding protein FerR (iron transport regulator)
MNTVIVPYGKRAQITLSDNSKIWLNSGSKLIYPACFATNKREVYLEGEAIFEVSHNKKHPFIVITADLDVRVLGTVFNVSSYRDDQTTSTILESGSVELNYKSNSVFGRSKELMVPGMLAIYNPEQGNVEQSKVNTRHYTSWRDGYFIFEKQPLGGILKKISRYYNVSVRLSDEELGKETFSGNLDLKNSPDQVLKIIAELISAKVENIDNQIVITRI